ncbi:MAG: flavin reductase family protein [Clostridiales bacterium]|nr:flavin reductase family protein [Clostridiales bacterium]
MAMKEISIDELNLNPVNAFDKGWAILTAGDKTGGFNGMTVSWGAMGEIWGKPAAFVFVRPQRYTLEFCEKSDYFTVSFFDGSRKKELGFFGSKSGRDYDKFKETGLTPETDGEFVYCGEAKTVLLCKKIAKTEFMPENFYDSAIEDCYTEKDYHKIFVGEIVKVLKNTDTD